MKDGCLVCDEPVVVAVFQVISSKLIINDVLRGCHDAEKYHPYPHFSHPYHPPLSSYHPIILYSHSIPHSPFQTPLPLRHLSLQGPRVAGGQLRRVVFEVRFTHRIGLGFPGIHGKVAMVILQKI